MEFTERPFIVVVDRGFENGNARETRPGRFAFGADLGDAESSRRKDEADASEACAIVASLAAWCARELRERCGKVAEEG
jgi:hypothetical protein